MPPAARPLVTLGIPVFNGESFLAEALASIQRQTWSPLEILVSDNASTDGTERICRQAAAQDPRIRYIRQPVNRGAAANFLTLAQEARGELFAWCAHDDRREPGFVAACVAELARRPEAVLCNSGVRFVDERGRPMPEVRDRNFATWSSTRPERAQRLLRQIHWVDMYGLIRREILLRCLPIEPVWGGDVVLSMKLLMQGEFAKVEQPLFQYRIETRPRSIEKTLEAVTNVERRLQRPYTELAQALFRQPLEAAESEDERTEVLWRFLRTLTHHDPDGWPHTCWRRLLSRENEGALGRLSSRPRFAQHLLGWLAEVLTGTPDERWARAVTLVRRGVRRVLLAGPGGAGEEERLPGIVARLRAGFPEAEVALLWQRWRGPSVDLGAGVRILRHSRRTDATAGLWPGADLDLRRVRAYGPDVIVCPFSRRSRRLDQLAAGSGAILTAARSLPAREASGRFPHRVDAYDPDHAWGVILPEGGGPESLDHWIETLRAPP